MHIHMSEEFNCLIDQEPVRTNVVKNQCISWVYNKACKQLLGPEHHAGLLRVSVDVDKPCWSNEISFHRPAKMS